MILVLLPGLDGTGDLFKSFIDALPNNINVLVISYQEPESLNNSKYSNYSQLIKFVKSQLPKEDYILLAESFSGYIAYQIAYSNPTHLKSVIFVASFLTNPRPFLLNLFNLLPARLLLSNPPPDFIIKLMMLGFSTNNTRIESLKRTLKQVSADILTFRLREINKLRQLTITNSKICIIPTLYIQATNDYLVPEKAIENFQQSFNNLSIVRVSGSHFILQSNPIECANILTQHLTNQELL